MTSSIRSSLARSAAIVVVVGLGSVGTIAAGTSASAATRAAVSTATSSSAASAATSGVTTPAVTAPATAAPASGTTTGTASGTAAGAASGTAAATPATPTTTAPTTATPTTTSTGNGTGSADGTVAQVPASTVPGNATPGATTTGDAPTLAVQNATDNHVMGATIPATDPAAKPASIGLKSATTSTTPTIRLTAASSANQLAGFDVSAYQTLTAANWKTAYAGGARFAYIKATEGTSYVSSQFANQYANSRAAGIIRGAYDFAHPNLDAAAEARHFVANGGSWSADGMTLPPLLDIEYGSASQGGTCWGVGTAAMVSWIATFTGTVKALTGVNPAIYSTSDWWSRCTGNTAAFGANPLFIAHYTSATVPGTLPASWATWSFWQWADAGGYPGDQDVFNGTIGALKTLAMGGSVASVSAGSTSGSTLATGATLVAGASRTSPNGQYSLKMQSDGNLVLYGNGRALWATGTSGQAGSRFVVQTDGNAVVYKGNTPLWSTGTNGGGLTPTMYLQSNGNLALSTSYGVPWQTHASGSDTAVSVTKLVGGQYLHAPNGLTSINMQPDGNLVVYYNGSPRWASNTAGNAGAYLAQQTDGNLVVYSKAGKALWNTHTSGKAAKTVLAMQNDGNLVLYPTNTSAKAIWNARTQF